MLPRRRGRGNGAAGAVPLGLHLGQHPHHRSARDTQLPAMARIDAPAWLPLHDLMTQCFVHAVSRPGRVPPVGPNTNSATTLASSPTRAASGSRISRSRAFNSRSPGVRSQCSMRVNASSACVKCLANQFPARLKRGSRRAVGSARRLGQRLARLGQHERRLRRDWPLAAGRSPR